MVRPIADSPHVVQHEEIQAPHAEAAKNDGRALAPTADEIQADDGRSPKFFVADDMAEAAALSWLLTGGVGMTFLATQRQQLSASMSKAWAATSTTAKEFRQDAKDLLNAMGRMKDALTELLKKIDSGDVKDIDHDYGDAIREGAVTEAMRETGVTSDGPADDGTDGPGTD